MSVRRPLLIFHLSKLLLCIFTSVFIWPHFSQMCLFVCFSCLSDDSLERKSIPFGLPKNRFKRRKRRILRSKLANTGTRRREKRETRDDRVCYSKAVVTQKKSRAYPGSIIEEEKKNERSEQGKKRRNKKKKNGKERNRGKRGISIWRQKPIQVNVQTKQKQN